MKIQIERGENGFVLRLPAEGEAPEHVEVFEYKGSPGNQAHVDAWARCLRSLDEYVGPSTGRYSPARVRIEIKPGDKFEDDVP